MYPHILHSRDDQIIGRTCYMTAQKLISVIVVALLYPWSPGESSTTTGLICMFPSSSVRFTVVSTPPPPILRFPSHSCQISLHEDFPSQSQSSSSHSNFRYERTRILFSTAPFHSSSTVPFHSFHLSTCPAHFYPTPHQLPPEILFPTNILPQLLHSSFVYSFCNSSHPVICTNFDFLMMISVWNRLTP